ncbi:hypothetical protein ACSBL2_02375 [Pedobacter sp. AW31-3R]|uniref:hypothetical protein n=1 Tax=Pedobacter sp. AW31-3R TaxID=3445781 RepID=UPI003F9F41C8
MRKICCITILFFSCAGAVAQSIAVINGSPISQREFIWIYQKHRPGNAKVTATQLISFLNIYIDFKLKVIDAREQGMDKDSTYLAEVQNYEQAFRSSAPVNMLQTDYQLVMNEYKEALLLFNISEKKVWDTISDTGDSIYNYYISHSSDYNGAAYEEVKSEVAADYQQHLECDWVTGLRNKYKVTIDQNAVMKLIR